LTPSPLCSLHLPLGQHPPKRAFSRLRCYTYSSTSTVHYSQFGQERAAVYTCKEEAAPADKRKFNRVHELGEKVAQSSQNASTTEICKLASCRRQVTIELVRTFITRVEEAKEKTDRKGWPRMNVSCRQAVLHATATDTPAQRRAGDSLRIGACSLHSDEESMAAS
jgi:hypothetical protein